MELEKELKARILSHKVAIVKATLAHSYIVKEKARGGVILSDPCLEQNALKFANDKLTGIMFAGKLEEVYDEAWESLKDIMPDNYSIMQESNTLQNK